MRRFFNMNFDTKVLAVFFAALFLLSVAHFFVYPRIWSAAEQDALRSNTEHLDSAVRGANATLDSLWGSFSKLIINKGTLYNAGPGDPDAYTASVYLECIKKSLLGYEFVDSWTLFFRDGNHVVSNTGSYSGEWYLKNRCYNEEYSMDTWKTLLGGTFSRFFCSEQEYRCIGGTNQQEYKRLMPIVFKSFWSDKVMLVMFFDMHSFCKNADPYLVEDLYIFSDAGEMLYASDLKLQLTGMPDGGRIKTENGMFYAIQSTDAKNNLVFVKLIPQERINSVQQRNLLRYLLLEALILVLVVAIIMGLSKKLLKPVNGILRLLGANEAQQRNSLQQAYEQLKTILDYRKQQMYALAERDAILSEYFLQSALKNVHITDAPKPLPVDGSAYIIYIEIQYVQSAWTASSVCMSEVEGCLRDMLCQRFESLFEMSTIFQLEPRHFVAKVTMQVGTQDMKERMQHFMQMLKSEEEYACFVVIQSQALPDDVDLAGVFSQVMEAMHYAEVEGGSQLLILPIDPEKLPQYMFTSQQSHILTNAIQNGNVKSAGQLIDELLEKNLKRHLSQEQMQMLCISIVNTIVESDIQIMLSTEDNKIVAGMHQVLTNITTKCQTKSEYLLALHGFLDIALQHCNESDPTDQILRKAEQYLLSNYQRDFSLEEMATALQMSRSYLSSYYKGKTGVNLSDNVQRFRIQRAMELLRSQHMKISEVGTAVGICNSNTFLRQFKKYTGMTPKEYRQSITNLNNSRDA